MKTNIDENNFETIANNLHNFKFKYIKGKKFSLNTPIGIICPKHGVFKQRLAHHIYRKQQCPKCSYELRSEMFIKPVSYYVEKCKTLYNGKYTLYPETYINASVKAKYNCPEHGDFYLKPSRFINNSGCQKCSIQKRVSITKKTFSYFLNKAILVHGDLYDYNNCNFISMSKPIEIYCHKHGYFKQLPKNHIKGSGCHLCNYEKASTSQKQSALDFITKAKLVHGDKYDYSLVEYSNNKIPVKVICRTHGIFMVRPDLHLHGPTGCPICNESKGESKIASVLDKYNAAYIREYKIPNFNFRYDFYIPKLKLLIEYDGEMHFKAIDNFGGKDQLLKTQARDKIKNKLAKDFGYFLIRIHYSDFKDLEHKLLLEISKYYKYYYNSSFYTNITEMLKNEHIVFSDVAELNKYLLISITKKLRSVI